MWGFVPETETEVFNDVCTGFKFSNHGCVDRSSTEASVAPWSYIRYWGTILFFRFMGMHFSVPSKIKYCTIAWQVQAHQLLLQVLSHIQVYQSRNISCFYKGPCECVFVYMKVGWSPCCVVQCDSSIFLIEQYHYQLYEETIFPNGNPSSLQNIPKMLNIFLCRFGLINNSHTHCFTLKKHWNRALLKGSLCSVYV